MCKQGEAATQCTFRSPSHLCTCGTPTYHACARDIAYQVSALNPRPCLAGDALSEQQHFCAVANQFTAVCTSLRAHVLPACSSTPCSSPDPGEYALVHKQEPPQVRDPMSSRTGTSCPEGFQWHLLSSIGAVSLVADGSSDATIRANRVNRVPSMMLCAGDLSDCGWC